MKLRLKKILSFPSPKDMGLSKYNALPSRKFTPTCKGPTWEDYYDLLKSRYPIRYKIYEVAQSIDIWLSVHIFMQLSQMWYWIKSHTTNKQHLLDLRQPDSGRYDADNYKWGYCDVDSKMVFAVFNLLTEYHQHSKHKRAAPPSEEELKDPYIKRDYEIQIEVENILTWWNVYRKEDLQELDRMTSEWAALKRDSCDSDKEKKLFKDIHRFEEDLEDQLEKMLIRVMKIRTGLWT